MLVQIGEFGCKFRISLGSLVGLFQFQDQRHQGFGNIAAAKNAKMTVFIGSVTEGIGGQLLVHMFLAFVGYAALELCESLSYSLTVLMKAAIFAMSFTPGADSTPEETSIGVSAGNRQCLIDIPGVQTAGQHVVDSAVHEVFNRFQSKDTPFPPGKVRPFGCLCIQQKTVGNALVRRQLYQDPQRRVWQMP